MAKPEWGMKRVCAACGARFYDMSRDPIICPKCGAENDKDATLRLRRGGKGAKYDAAKKAEPLSAEDVILEDDVVLEGDDGGDEALIEDASDLEEDDDMGEMIDGIEAPREED